MRIYSFINYNYLSVTLNIFDANMISSENYYEGWNVCRRKLFACLLTLVFKGDTKTWLVVMSMPTHFFFFLSSFLLFLFFPFFFFNLYSLSAKKKSTEIAKEEPQCVFVVPLSCSFNNNTSKRQKKLFFFSKLRKNSHTQNFPLIFFLPCGCFRNCVSRQRNSKSHIYRFICFSNLYMPKRR